jgi:hypothetical protein
VFAYAYEIDGWLGAVESKRAADVNRARCDSRPTIHGGGRRRTQPMELHLTFTIQNHIHTKDRVGESPRHG